MDSAYSEMKIVPEMRNSINAILSNQRRSYRPPALSESFAWTPENIHRASNTSLNLMVTNSPQVSPTPQPPRRATKCINYALRFLFHISLISIFESLFFFFYISNLEDNGINKAVGGVIDNAVNSCSNLTTSEIQVTNFILGLLINSTTIINNGNAAAISRNLYNKHLFMRSWIYVGGLSGLFLLLTIIALANKLVIKWKKLIIENIILVFILAAYEYTFFSTVIFPYNAISGEEILRNTVYEFQDKCGIVI